MPNEKITKEPENTNNQDNGTVYFALNPAFPDYVKIGSTKEDLQGRFDQLNDTNVPFPFACIYACEVKNYKQVEKTIHRILAPYRMPGKEFFKLPQDKNIITHVQELLELLCIKDVTDTVQKQMELNFKAEPVCIETTDSNVIPKHYKTYQELKKDISKTYPLVFTDDIKDGLLAYRVAGHHRVKNVKYYKLNNICYYNPNTFEDEVKIEEDNKRKEAEQAES
jgi:hypothetical protein